MGNIQNNKVFLQEEKICSLFYSQTIIYTVSSLDGQLPNQQFKSSRDSITTSLQLTIGSSAENCLIKLVFLKKWYTNHSVNQQCQAQGWWASETVDLSQHAMRPVCESLSKNISYHMCEMCTTHSDHIKEAAIYYPNGRHGTKLADTVK